MNKKFGTQQSNMKQITLKKVIMTLSEKRQRFS